MKNLALLLVVIGSVICFAQTAQSPQIKRIFIEERLKAAAVVPLIVMRMEIALEVREREQEMYLWSLREKLQNGALPF